MWLFMSLAVAVVAAYVLLTVGRDDYQLAGATHVLASTVALWWLARLFWRKAERLVAPPEVEPGSPEHIPGPGEGLLTAGIVIFGGYLFVGAVRAFVLSWSIYLETLDAFSYFGPSSEEFAFNQTSIWTTYAAFDFAAAVMLIFGGRHLAARLSRSASSDDP